MVQFKDVTFLMDDGTPHIVTIIVTDFKNNTTEKPFEILIEREDILAFCPVKALLEYCTLRGSHPDPLFYLVNTCA